MKLKELKIPAIIIAVGLAVAVVACLLVGILKTPTITEQDFNYSATYKLNGETKTLEGVYRCKFKYTGEGIVPYERYYEGYYLSDSTAGEPESHTLAQKDDLKLCIVFIFTDDYLMGDGDAGEAYSDAIPDPYLAVYDKEGCEYQDSETLEQFDAQLISWQTPQPIKNKFVFSGFSHMHSGSMLIMLLVGILTIVACIIFVKKDKSYKRKPLDDVSMVMNYVFGFVGIPFITLVTYLMGIYVSGDEIIYQIDLCLPALMAFIIAASLSLRRKGYKKTSFFIQFVGPALFILLLFLESIV